MLEIFSINLVVRSNEIGSSVMRNLLNCDRITTLFLNVRDVVIMVFLANCFTNLISEFYIEHNIMAGRYHHRLIRAIYITRFIYCMRGYSFIVNNSYFCSTYLIF